MEERTRRAWTGAAVVVVAASLWGCGSDRGSASGDAPANDASRGALTASDRSVPSRLLGPLPRGTRLLVRGVDPRAPRADAGLYEATEQRPQRTGTLSCKRVHVSPAGTGLCLAVAASGTTYDGIVFDDAYHLVRRFPIEGIPDRVRVSPDGRYGAYTSFDPAGSLEYFASTERFSTYTRIHDMRSGRELTRLERLRVTRGGKRVSTRGAELWGVTFGRGGRFYATLARRGRYHLIAGRVGDRHARVIRDGVECPALSPDGRRIAYKRRVGRREWRFHVLDLDSDRDVELAERRSVDDQPEWLGDSRVVYSDDRAVFAVPADGRGAPELLVRRATSPVPVEDSGKPATANEVAARAGDDDPAPVGGDKTYVKEVVDDVQDGLLAEDGGICFELTDAAERRLAVWAGDPGGTCFNAIGTLTRRRHELGVESVRSRVLSIAVKGGWGKPFSAVAVVEDPGGRRYRVRFVKEDGEWALARFFPESPSGLGPPAST